MAETITGNMMTGEAAPLFDHPLIREYCLKGKLPKRCFEGIGKM